MPWVDTPEKCGLGCTACFLKPLPYFRTDKVIFIFLSDLRRETNNKKVGSAKNHTHFHTPVPKRVLKKQNLLKEAYM